jgi:ADP-ribose pyrophosphatase
MRRAVIPVIVGCALLSPPGASAKFGISKTRVTLTRYRPPDVVLLGDTVAVRVVSDSRAVTNAHLSLVRSRIEDALRAWNVVRVVDSTDHADDVVEVSIEDLTARLRDSVRYEDKYVKIGERQEWDEKKQKNVTRDVYGYRKQPVSLKLARGRIDARVRVTTPAGPREADAGSSYDERFDENDRLPPEAYSEDSLERLLVEQTAAHAVAAVCFSPEAVPAMLAVDGELKTGNQLAQTGQFREALTEWSRRSYQGDTEAARLHNLGVAHEAIAYKLPVDSADHRQQLEQAAESYRKARELDPGEKYFAEPIQRVETSMVYARAAADLMAERDRWAARAARDQPADRRPVRKPAALVEDGSVGAAPAGWTFERGTVAVDAVRGKVLELDGTARPAAATRRTDVGAQGGGRVARLQGRLGRGAGAGARRVRRRRRQAARRDLRGQPGRGSRRMVAVERRPRRPAPPPRARHRREGPRRGRRRTPGQGRRPRAVVMASRKVDPPVRVLSHRRVYDGKILSLELDEIQEEGGAKALREVVRHRGSVAALPVDDEGRLVLVRQYRHPIGRPLWEVPAGILEKGESPEQAVRREVEEEVGRRAGHLERLAVFHPTPGFCDEVLHLFRATRLAEASVHPDDDEVLEVKWYTLDEARRLLDAGEVKDAKTIIALLMESEQRGSRGRR